MRSWKRLGCPECQLIPHSRGLRVIPGEMERAQYTLGDLEAEKETKNLRASSRNRDSGEKRYASISRS